MFNAAQVDHLKTLSKMNREKGALKDTVKPSLLLYQIYAAVK